MRSAFLNLCLALCCCCTVFAQDSIPVLKGRLNLSVTKGTIEGHFTLSNIPRLNDYVIRLNSGLNVRYFRNLDANVLIYYDKSHYDSLAYETTAYYFPGNKGKGKFLPKAVEFSYVGAFPVVRDTVSNYSVEDWKGNIAFNGYSLRADGRQSAWYPVLYDSRRDVVYDKVKYDIEIECADCNTLYVNGSVPVKGRKAQFRSDLPRELTLYCGSFNTVNMNDTYFLNPDLSPADLKQFGTLINGYKHYYEQHLGISYKDRITFIQTTPVSKNNAWLFVSYPTIVNIGWGDYGMKMFIDRKRGDWFKPYMAHELGHYYFGTYKKFNAELGDMMSEGFAEFLSFKLTKALISDSIYRQKISGKIKSLKEFTPVPFSKVRSVNDYKDRELYVYYYAPLLFTAIEKEIGEPAMWQWMKALLETPVDFTNYAFLTQTLKNTLKDDKKTEALKARYFESDKAIGNAVETIGIK